MENMEDKKQSSTGGESGLLDDESPQPADTDANNIMKLSVNSSADTKNDEAMDPGRESHTYKEKKIGHKLQVNSG